jgi:phosphate:Na+ symporter
MKFSVLDLLTILGSLGFFIYGMKVMSEGLQKASGEQLRFALGSMTKNRYLGVISGFLITALIQSSSATTVMTVSFVNAGLLTLTQSAGIMMGANIGTTITAWLVSTFGFKVKIAALALPIIAFAFPMMFAKNKKIKYWSEFLIGFSLLFMGLGFLKSAVPDIKENPEILDFLQGFVHWGYGSYILFIIIGAVLTIVVQSSSASMTITLVLVAKGWISFEIAAAMVLGENIGTTITAEVAAIVGNVHAKRSARIHSMFNIIGVTWMLLVFPFFVKGVDMLTYQLFGLAHPLTAFSTEELSTLSESEYAIREQSVTYGLSIFHTLFNLANVILLIGFAPQLVKLAIKTVPSRNKSDEEFHLEYIDIGAIKSPGLSLMEVQKELHEFSTLLSKMVANANRMLTEVNKAEVEELFNRIRKQEEHTDRLEIEIADYLSKVSTQELNRNESLMLRSMLSVVHDLERIADILFQVGMELYKKSENRDWFTPKQRGGLLDMIDLLNKAISRMRDNLEDRWNAVDMEPSLAIEKEIDALRRKLHKQHISSIEKRDYNIRSGLIYSNLYNLIERAGDHVINVNEAINENA